MKTIIESIFDNDQTYLDNSSVDLGSVETKEQMIDLLRKHNVLFTPQELKKLPYETLGKFEDEDIEFHCSDDHLEFTYILYTKRIRSSQKTPVFKIRTNNSYRTIRIRVQDYNYNEEIDYSFSRTFMAWRARVVSFIQTLGYTFNKNASDREEEVWNLNIKAK